MARKFTIRQQLYTAALTAIGGSLLASSALLAAVTREGLPLTVAWALLATLAAALCVAAYFFVRHLTSPLKRLRQSIRKIAEGDLNVRTALTTQDEFGDISRGIDGVLNNRVSALMNIESENEQLNDSIVALLETVARLSQKDLTIKARVSSDMTGAIADALNLMTQETVKVLHQVTAVSASVAEASNLVKSEADNIVISAKKEKEEVEQAKRELTAAAESMTRVARLAVASSQAADEAIKTTRAARAIVTETVNGIDRIRDGIRETEKRIKRLGERSQEISGVVNLINQISERTQVLSLNASMHAASAGEAGRGFGVVADEVQRLVENTREATTQIGQLVNNIQAETSLVSNTMNNLISQVVEGSRAAEKSGEQMHTTEDTTAKLVQLVRHITTATVSQAKVNQVIQKRTGTILDSVSQTGTHLLEQSEHIDQLLEQTLSLVQSVGVFKLPEMEAEEAAYKMQDMVELEDLMV
jgi:methyl-accepting chemotaxis protein